MIPEPTARAHVPRDATISDRKKEHLDIAADAASQSAVRAGWEDVHLIHRSLPEVSTSEVRTDVRLAGFAMAAPLMIASMTGGHPAAVSINERLARAAQEIGVAVGSGSQRAALRDPSLRSSYSVLRSAAPDAVVLANIGVCQLVPQRGEPALTEHDVHTLVDMLDAQALIVHLNVVEELVQPEGDRNTTGLVAAIARVVEWSRVPVIVKETGAGIGGESAHAIAGAGAQAIDVGGAGGTSFAAIEGVRAARRGDTLGARLGTALTGWGIPTAISLVEARSAGLPLIATGGVRSGVDMAKAIALGATAVGIGRPALLAAQQGYEALLAELHAYLTELKTVMTLIGCVDIPALQQHRPVVTGMVRRWAEQRGLQW